MGKVLIIAEKPSLAREIIKALDLKGKTTPERFLEAGDVIVANVRGHALRTKDPKAMDPNWQAWSMRTLPMLPKAWDMEPTEDPQIRQWLEAIVRYVNDPSVTKIVNACDPAREGQLIFDEIMAYTKCQKPQFRFWHESLADSDLKAAWAHLEPASKRQGLTDAAWCRQQSDWLIGLNATRAQTLMVRSHNQDSPVQNIGRVQTPVLAMLVDLDTEIRNFKPKDFFTVKVDQQAEAGAVPGTWFKAAGGTVVDRLDTEAEAQAILAKTQGKEGTVKSVTCKDEKKPPEQLFDLTQLQREANQKHGFTADHTLEVLQGLYEAKLTTYPRTNSRYLTPGDMAEKVPQAIKTLERAGYKAFTDQVPDPAPKLSKRFVDASMVEDHSAIIPTENVPGNLSADQKAIYDMVARRLLGAFFPDRVLAKTDIVTTVVGETFKTKGTVTKVAGWEEVDPSTKKKGPAKGDDEDRSLPDVKKGDKVTLTGGAVKPGKTSPPKPYTESDVLGAMVGASRLVDDQVAKKAMKDCGLGTPATRAAIIEELLRRNLVERVPAGPKTVNLVPTAHGISLIQNIKQTLLKSPELTGQWEAKLALVAAGKMTKDQFMGEIVALTGLVVGEIRSHVVRRPYVAPTAAPAVPVPATQAELFPGAAPVAPAATEVASALAPGKRKA
jgi:DNA topoisomerase-3